jgi:hypothetical protein
MAYYNNIVLYVGSGMIKWTNNVAASITRVVVLAVKWIKQFQISSTPRRIVVGCMYSL